MQQRPKSSSIQIASIARLFAAFLAMSVASSAAWAYAERGHSRYDVPRLYLAAMEVKKLSEIFAEAPNDKIIASQIFKRCFSIYMYTGNLSKSRSEEQWANSMVIAEYFLKIIGKIREIGEVHIPKDEILRDEFWRMIEMYSAMGEESRIKTGNFLDHPVLKSDLIFCSDTFKELSGFPN